MNGFAQIRTLLEEWMRQRGVPTLAEWTRKSVPELTEPAAVVGISESQSGSAAFWNYLGTQWDEERGCAVERYGKTVHLTLYVDFYAPAGKAAALEQAVQILEELFLEQRGSGLCFSSVRREAIQSDGASGYLKSRCTVECTACFTAARSEDGAALTDFILKGVLQ